MIVRAGGQLYLGVGSDHTDRDIERESVPDSKAACPEPISTGLVALTSVDAVDWDRVEARCTVDGVDYQSGLLSALRIPTDVLGLYDDHRGHGDRDVVLYGGTFPLIDGAFVAGTHWTLSLTLPGRPSISHTYSTSVRAR